MGTLHVRRAFLLAALAVAFAGCGCGDNNTPTFHTRWTFMVYMDGDNNLEQFGVLNMKQMEAVGSTANVNIVVQFDRAGNFTGDAGHWVGARRFLVRRDGNTTSITSPVLQDLGVVNMADPAVMQEFIAWATTTFPADRYVLVPWNHGAGWRARAGRGVIFDDTSDTFMTMADLNAGMTVPGVHFDLTAFDASLMGMLEVCYEIRDRTDYVNASEESPPATGYPYDAILSRLVANPDMTPEQLGQIIVAQYVAHYPNNGVTQSLIRTDRLPAFALKTAGLATALLRALPAQSAAVEQARSSSQAYAFSYYRDLVDLALKVQADVPDANAVAAAAAVIQGASGANGGPILAEGHTLAAEANSHGLSIYLPGAGQLFGGYRDLQFAQDYPTWYTLVTTISPP